MDHRGWTKAVGGVVRSEGGLTGPGKRSRMMLSRGLEALGDTGLEDEEVLSCSRSEPSRGWSF